LGDASPARGAAKAGEFKPDAKDVRSHPRDTPPSLGAFAYVASSASTLPY
jgi:hypothetical protein